MGLTPSPASGARRGASLSAEEVKKAVEPYDANQDEIDRDNIVQQPRHEQNQRPANDGNERHHVMDDGGHPHIASSLLGMISADRQPAPGAHQALPVVADSSPAREVARVW